MSSQDQTQIFTKPKERADLSAGPANVPVWMFTLLTVLLFCGGLYLERFSGGFNAMVYEPVRSFSELERLQPRSEAGGLVPMGRQVYRDICASCHMPSGMGNPPTIPPLAGSEWVMEEHPDRIIRIVLHGLSGPVEVNGKQYGSTAMTALGVLTDQQIAAALTFVRQEWGNQAPPVTEEQVIKVREETADRPGGLNWTAQELLAIPLSE